MQVITMQYGVLVFYILVLVCAGASREYGDYFESCESSEECGGGIAAGYACVQGQCRCARGFLLHPQDGTCVVCPKLGQQCFGYCCSPRSEELQCWQGSCRKCRDQHGGWACGDQLDTAALVSATQIAMGTALVLGLLATFVLLYKLCATSDVSSFGAQSYTGGRLSVGSLELYVEQRLRDAPPRYSRASPAAAVVPPIFPLHGYLNAGFIHDFSVPPPPPYSAPKEDRIACAASPVLHI